MRVILVSDYGHVNGGAAQVAISSARLLAKQGIPVVFACALGPISPQLDHPLIETHCLGETHIWAVRQPWRAAAQAIWNAAASQWLRTLIHESDPNQTVVHLHQWTKAFSPSVLAAATTSRLPFVVTLHDYFLSCPNGAYFIYPKQRPCTVQPMSATCWSTNCDSRSSAHKAVRLLRQVATVTAVRRRNTPLHVIHVSRRAAEVARPLLPPTCRHWVLQNPVNEALGTRITAEHNRAVVCVGRVTVEKGCVVVAQATARARMPLVVMGEGPALEQVREANPNADIRPWGDREAVERCFEEARVLALPSLWHETGGLVAQEAMARGVPAIVSTISGASDIVHRAQGPVVPPGDTGALTKALRELENDTFVRHLSEQAYHTMSTGPQRPGAHAEGLINIYRSILAEHQQEAV